MAAYRRLLAVRSVRRLLLFAVLARIPPTAFSVVLTLHVVTDLHLGYGAAGVAVMAVTVGMAVGFPWQGRAIDRFGLRATLLPLALISTLVWAVAPLIGYPPLVALVLIGGLFGLPVFTVIRLCLSVLVPADQRRTALAMDSVGVEVSFMIGPAAGVLAATQLGGTAALLLLAGGQLAVGLSLIALNPPTRAATVAEPPAAGTAAGRRLHWYTPALIAVLGIAAAGTLVLGGTDVGVVALLRAHGALSLTGLVFVAWGGGSILGGLVYGAAREPPQPVVLLFWLALLTVPVGLAPNPLLLTLTILPAAALCAPVITATADAVSRLVPEEVRGEALGWHGAALTVGQAAGAPLSGAVIDASAPWAGFAAVGALGGLLAVIALWLQRGRQQGRRPVPTRIMISQDAAEP